MATTTLVPNGDGTAFNIVQSAPYYAYVDEGTTTPNDSDILTFGGSGSIFLLLGDLPAECDTITGVSCKFRAQKAAKGNGSVGTLQVMQSNESTALTSSSVPTITTTMTTFTIALTITGATDKATWDGARLKIVNGSAGGLWDLSAVQLDITYTTSGGGGGVTTQTAFLVGF